MKAAYLGDANDHLKGSLHGLLRGPGLLRDLHAVPMATDDWSPAHRSAYARLLGLADVEHVVPTTTFPGPRRLRRGYFEEAAKGIPSTADVLVDPDTGIRALDAGRAHVLVSELATLTAQAPERLLLVYDEGHDRRVPKQRHVEQIAEALGRAVGPSVAYEAGRSLTMFVTSTRPQRLSQVHELLAGFLGPAKEGRLRSFF